MSAAFSVFSEWEILQGICSELCSQDHSGAWGPFCELVKGASQHRYIRKADTFELMNKKCKLWCLVNGQNLCTKWKALLPLGRYLVSGAEMGSAPFTISVGHCWAMSKPALALLWCSTFTFQWWDEMFLRIHCWKNKIIQVLGFAFIIIIFFKMFNWL